MLIARFNFTDSEMPRKLMNASTTTKTRAVKSSGKLTNATRSSRKYPPNASARAPVAAKLAATMQNATRKVKKRLLNARPVYMAAPAAWGYLVISSAYAKPVSMAAVTPTTNEVQNAPPTWAAITPMRA
jgi:hypothetical protein